MKGKDTMISTAGVSRCCPAEAAKLIDDDMNYVYGHTIVTPCCGTRFILRQRYNRPTWVACESKEKT